MKILVVDDAVPNRELLKWILEEDGFDVVEATNGQEAIEMFRQAAPDLILMDVMMPVMDGLEATRRIKNEQTDVYTPVIFLTALTDDESLVNCLAAGGDDFLCKPVNEIVLASKLRAHRRLKDLNTLINNKNVELNTLHALIINEHDIAKTVFENAISRCFLDCKNLRHYISPATTFNGDLFLAAPSAYGGIYLLLTDFTGHGLPAALGAIPLAQTFFTCAEKGLPISELAFELNRSLQKLLPDHMFAAASLLELDRSGTRVTLWSGGMPPLLIVNNKNQLKTCVAASHMSLGILEDYEFDYSISVLEVDKDDRLYLFTDGIIEARNQHNELYTQARLLEHFAGANIDPFQDIIADVKAFSGNEKQSDDITFIELTCNVIDSPYTIPKNAQEHALPCWELEFLYTAEDLKKNNLVTPIVDLIGGAPALKAHKDYLQSILAELLSNALEHGVLGLDSRLKESEDGFLEYYQQRAEKLAHLGSATIVVNIFQTTDAQGNLLHVSIKDSGNGFDAEKRCMGNESEHFGRRQALLESLCESVHYSEHGTRVDVIYRPTRN